VKEVRALEGDAVQLISPFHGVPWWNSSVEPLTQHAAWCVIACDGDTRTRLTADGRLFVPRGHGTL
jgi:hypothetical protein